MCNVIIQLRQNQEHIYLKIPMPGKEYPSNEMRISLFMALSPEIPVLMNIFH